MTADILIVEDDYAMREVLESACELAGVPCRTANDGLEALAAVEANRPRLIILDLMMPRMDGYAVLERLKACQETAGITVVVYTAQYLTQENKARIPIPESMILNKTQVSLADILALIESAYHGHLPV